MGKRYRNEDRGQDRPAPTVDYKSIIEQGDVDKMVVAAKNLAEDNKSVSSSQIRGLFASVRQIQLNWSTDPKQAYRQAKLLQPRIAYAADRNALGSLKDAINQSIRLVDGNEAERRQRFSNFVDFFEAIVAYHKPIAIKK